MKNSMAIKWIAITTALPFAIYLSFCPFERAVAETLLLPSFYQAGASNLDEAFISQCRAGTTASLPEAMRASDFAIQFSDEYCRCFLDEVKNGRFTNEDKGELIKLGLNPGKGISPELREKIEISGKNCAKKWAEKHPT